MYLEAFCLLHSKTVPELNATDIIFILVFPRVDGDLKTPVSVFLSCSLPFSGTGFSVSLELPDWLGWWGSEPQGFSLHFPSILGAPTIGQDGYIQVLFLLKSYAYKYLPA